METRFLIEYVVFALCHAAKGDPGPLTRERVAKMDERLFQAFGNTIVAEARRARLTLDKRIASTIMLMAVMSKFQDPRQSVPQAINNFLSARQHEVLDASRALFAPEAGAVAGGEEGTLDLQGLMPASPPEAAAGARRRPGR